jgi:hypothetical protein
MRARTLPELRLLLRPDQWQQMMEWPMDTCDGKLLADPRNRILVQLMQASVGDTTWASR